MIETLVTFELFVEGSRSSEVSKETEYQVHVQTQVQLSKRSIQTIRWSEWKTFADFCHLDQQLRQLPGIQLSMQTIPFAKLYKTRTLFRQIYSPKFRDQRRFELYCYLKQVLELPTITCFYPTPSPGAQVLSKFCHVHEHLQDQIKPLALEGEAKVLKFVLQRKGEDEVERFKRKARKYGKATPENLQIHAPKYWHYLTTTFNADEMRWLVPQILELLQNPQRKQALIALAKQATPSERKLYRSVRSRSRKHQSSKLSIASTTSIDAAPSSCGSRSTSRSTCASSKSIPDQVRHSAMNTREEAPAARQDIIARLRAQGGISLMEL